MTLQSSVGDESGPMEIIDHANSNLVRTIRALETALCRLETGEAGAGVEVQKAIAEMRKAQTVALSERQKVDEDRRKLERATGEGAIDFDAARIAILDCLDRVRRSRDAGQVPE